MDLWGRFLYLQLLCESRLVAVSGVELVLLLVVDHNLPYTHSFLSMQTRRPQLASPLAIALPHSLPRRASSLLSANSIATPRTPRSCGSPTCSNIFMTPAANRKSTDSWNSSNADDLEWEWKPEQILLLSRTLDALPSHLVTPFNGPIPPSNLLDKIARGVSQAKGPLEWPHSLRATRVKLIELSRSRAKEQARVQQRSTIAEEEEGDMASHYSFMQDSLEHSVDGGLGNKRPLYRQSSMDFMNAVGTDIKNNEHLARLSNRLQRAERHTTSHPYQRSTRANPGLRCSSPPASSTPSSINPSTPSSSTLNTLSSFASSPRALRRAMSVSSSSLSIMTTSSEGVLPNPRVQRLMQDDGIPPVLPPKDTPLTGRSGAKRAPSFGALAQEMKREHIVHTPTTPGQARTKSPICPSSDEEEKIRNKQAKKPRKQISFSTKATPPPDSSAPSAPTTPLISKSTPSVTKRALEIGHSLEAIMKGRVSKETKKDEPKEREKKKENLAALGLGRPSKKSSGKPLPMNLQRNPSMFGPELPVLGDSPLFPAPVISSKRPRPSSPSTAPKTLSPDVIQNPSTPKHKILRRVRRLAPARRISFSNLVPPGDEADADGEGEGEERGDRIELGSAFQLH